MLEAAATAVSVVKEDSALRMCAAPLLAKAGVEVEGRAACIKSNTIVNSRRREEDRCLLLHFDVPTRSYGGTGAGST